MAKGTVARPALRWRNSLVFRIVAACVVLVGCLLGCVYLLTGHYFQQVMQEVEDQTAEIVNTLQLQASNTPPGEVDLEKLREHAQRESGVPITIQKGNFGNTGGSVISRRTGKAYELVATYALMIGDEPFQLVAVFTIDPRTEIFRAFKNRYMLMLAGIFLVTLGLLIYFILKSLRPLRDLTEGCARISAGRLEPVEVRQNYGEILALENTFNSMVAALREKEIVEANLRQAQRLSALGSLAAGIAHDVRNPLNAIKLLSSHALDECTGNPESSPAVEHLRTIRKEVDRLDEIVSGFLALAKERELQPEPVMIDAMLEECVRLVRADAEARGVRLSSELRAGQLQLLLDPKQCKRAVLNVVINALEACPAGGRVRLFSRVTEDACQIEVRDDGPGMTKEVADQAFDPYFTTKPTGTGLGLSITRGIIEESGGTIEISSSVGQGCQVLISLPLNRKV